MKYIKIVVQKTLDYFGFFIGRKELYRIKANFEKVDDPENIVKLVRQNTMLLNDLRLINIRESISYISQASITGTYVECGVWKGGSSAYAAYCLKREGNIVPIHLFDAFDDICEPDAAVDGERAIKDVGGIQNAQGRLKAVKGVYDRIGGHGNDAHVRSLINGSIINYPLENIIIHKGWFQDTLPLAIDSIDRISILRLDGDWYSSTKVCLEQLYPLVSKGGVVIIDDYDAYDGCKKAVDEYLKSIGVSPFLIKVDDECVFFIKS